MVKPLAFKGEKQRKRKRADNTPLQDDGLRSRTNVKGGQDGDQGATEKSWVTADRLEDISGPIIIVVSSNPPSFLACDGGGKVFALEAENMLKDGEERPDPSTAEPHDVRGVWMANRIVGSESISLKGHHHKYLSCDAAGGLSASLEAINPQAQFSPVTTEAGMWAIATASGKFLTIDEPKPGKLPNIRGDGESITFDGSVWIRGQAKFKHKTEEAQAVQYHTRISRKELQSKAGRELTDEEVKLLRHAWKDGSFNQAVLDIRTKGKHDKFAPS